MSQLLSEIDGISNESPARSTLRTSLTVSALQETVLINDIDCPTVECSTATGEAATSEEFIRYYF